MSSTFRNILGPKNEPVRCLLVGGEPVAVVYDLPTGRHPSMTTQIVARTPSLKKLVYKTHVGTRMGYVADRACLRELAEVYSRIEAKGDYRARANETFVTWIRKDLIPFMDAWDKEMRDKKGTTPAKPNEIILGLKLGDFQVKGAFPDPNADVLTLVVNGRVSLFTPNQLASKLDLL